MPSADIPLLVPRRYGAPVESTSHLLFEKIATGHATVGVLGMGYVGLPLAIEFAKHFPTIGFDVNIERISALNAGQSYIGDAPNSDLVHAMANGSLCATCDFSLLASCRQTSGYLVHCVRR
jgi:UDP-N-acetyl-D-glucosamine dehydrogenase